MATTVLEFGVETPAKAPNTVVFVGKKEALQNDKLLPLLGGIDKPVRDQMLKDVSVGDNGASISIGKADQDCAFRPPQQELAAQQRLPAPRHLLAHRR
eukprot:CAMPEP_0172208580 /NCGR_PEP_ID=MMETSP1050-20130122/34557_1 /TAXON_ID=233186 /ORGANISM="Cryptomonas curvata, Strain CCAP979/52" /LENGTH=97 /DNA_ID=CAMNT_0012888199 /DNA_START=180 /DNA_END=470 /DNA_ORIENTATION=-